MDLSESGSRIFLNNFCATSRKLRGTRFSNDARFLQIFSLLAMFTFGVLGRDFNVTSTKILWIGATALVSQLVLIQFWKFPFSSLLSASISALGMMLLCRTNSVPVLSAAMALAIFSKVIFRWQGKHFFNPTNFGIMVVYLFSGAVWVSPGQWGDDFLMLIWILMMGTVVVGGARRYDISLTFLVAHIGLIGSRVLYLGQSAAVFWHQLANGSLIIFAFFMISDPRSTPNHKVGRMVFAVSVALLAYYFRIKLFNPQALLWALFILSPITVILDSVLRARRFEWKPSAKEIVYAKPVIALS